MNFIRSRTRRHLLKVASAAAAATPFFMLQAGSAIAGEKDPSDPNPGNDCKNDGTGPKCSCFLKGTKISTPYGEIPIEQLKQGDEVCTLDGVKKIKWIGYNKFQADSLPQDLPIRIARFAIDEETPYCDLYLSPAHCLFSDGVLIPVSFFINESTITPHLHVETIEYYHLEFDAHEIIFAQGTMVESYRGSGRENFANRAEFSRLYGSQEIHAPYAPVCGYNGGRDELKGLLRSVVSNFIDVRDPIQIASDRLAARAARLGLPADSG